MIVVMMPRVGVVMEVVGCLRIVGEDGERPVPFQSAHAEHDDSDGAESLCGDVGASYGAYAPVGHTSCKTSCGVNILAEEERLLIDEDIAQHSAE